MFPRPRQLAAIALWAVALWPLLLLAVHPVSPVAAVALADGAAAALSSAALVALGLGAGLLVAWPPFLPALRVRLQRWRLRARQDPARLDQALAHLQHLDTAAARADVAHWLLDAGRLRDAVPHLRRAIELAPEMVSARFLLGRTLRQLGDRDGAAATLRQVIAAEADHGFGVAALELARVEAEQALGGGEREAMAAALAALRRHEARSGPDREASLLQARLAARLGDRGAMRTALQAAAGSPPAGVRLSPDEALLRARARVALWTWGRA